MHVRRTKIPSVGVSASLTQHVLAPELPRNTLFSHVPWLAVASAVERGRLPSSRGRDIEIVTLEECLKVKDDVTCPEAWLVGWRPHAAAIALRYSMTDDVDVCVFLLRNASLVTPC